MSILVPALGLLITLAYTALTAATSLDTLLIAYTLQHTHGTFRTTVITTGQRPKPKHAADGETRCAS